MSPSSLLLLLALPARAAFYPVEQVPVRPEGGILEKASAAVQRISLYGGNCSGSLLSPDGYVLTAFHCVEKCLQGTWDAPNDGAETVQTERFKLVRSRKRRPDYLCPRGEPLGIIHDNANQPRVVWTGRGYETFKDSELKGLPEEVVENLRELVDDYAILKYELRTPAPCLRLAQAPPKPGETLWALGYPAWTDRPDGHNSAGPHRQHASFGPVRASLREDPYLQGLLTSEEEWRKEERVFGDGNAVLAGIDVHYGNSGGPLLDSRGEVAAVLYSSVHGSGSVDYKSSALGIPAWRILRDVREGLGEEAASRVFDCPRERLSLKLPPAAAAAPRFDGSR